MHFDLLNGSYLFSSDNGDPSGYFWAMAVFLGVLFVVSALAYWRRATFAPDNPVARRLIRRAAKAGMWTAAIGIFFAITRSQNILYVGMPIWLLLDFLAMIFIAGYFIYELSERYPLAVWRLQESSLERRYRPAPRPSREPQRVRPKVRGKRRR